MQTSKYVSILVLMDVAFELKEAAKVDERCKGFNPCSYGCCF